MRIDGVMYDKNSQYNDSDNDIPFQVKERITMRNMIQKGLALGLGLAVTTKEQVEKVVDELVEKGELSKQESKQFVDELLKKGQETKKDIDEKINQKLKQSLNELDLATKEEVDELKKRVEQLEKEQSE